MICQRGDKLIQIVDQQKNSYLDLIEKHRLADHWLYVIILLVLLDDISMV